MGKKVTITVGEQELELKLTMLRMELFNEHTGIDLSKTGQGEKADEVLRTIPGIGGALYALAGGEDITGLSLAQFKDELTPVHMREFGEKFSSIYDRDTGRVEGGQGNAPKARKRKSPSRTSKPSGASGSD